MWPVTQTVTEEALLSTAPKCRTHIEYLLCERRQPHHLLFLGWQRPGHWQWCTGQHSPGSQAHNIHNQILLHPFPSLPTFSPPQHPFYAHCLTGWHSPTKLPNLLDPQLCISSPAKSQIACFLKAHQLVQLMPHTVIN